MTTGNIEGGIKGRRMNLSTILVYVALAVAIVNAVLLYPIWAKFYGW